MKYLHESEKCCCRLKVFIVTLLDDMNKSCGFIFNEEDAANLDCCKSFKVD